jgi:polysaccharide biosynthesis/export protein
MFNTEGYTELMISDSTIEHFQLKPYDAITLDVFTKDGERLIDPDFELADRSIQNVDALKPKLNFLIQQDGKVRLPMVGEVTLAGYTLREAEIFLQQEYSAYYQDPYVNLDFGNKRVVLLGALGSKVIPLNEEEIRVTEIFGLAEGIDKDAKMGNIRLLRGNDVYQLDFSTVAGYQKSNLVVQPNDIIYVEPVRRPFQEALRDYGTLFSIVTSLTSLIVVIISLN